MTNYEWLIAHKDIKQSECLIWPFAMFNTHYGHLRHERKSKYAHRVMCELAHGPAPEGKPWALHTCNKGDGSNGCVNPEHLFWGNQIDNWKLRKAIE